MRVIPSLEIGQVWTHKHYGWKRRILAFFPGWDFRVMVKYAETIGGPEFAPACVAERSFREWVRKNCLT